MIRQFSLISALFLCGLNQQLKAQGNIEVIGESLLQQMIDERVSSVDTTKLTGFRIQIYFGSNRADAQDMQAIFNANHPEWSNESYLLYYDPNWRLRIGNFYRKIDAQPMMDILQKEFGNVFLIRDNISLPALRFEE